MREFRPRAGRSMAGVLLVLALGFLPLVGVAALKLTLPDHPDHVATVIAVSCLVTPILLALVVLGPSRMRYLVGEGRVEVQTMFSRKSWPLREVRARAHFPKVTLRLFGTSFPGYHTGFYRADGETTRLYATDLSAGILLEGPARVFVSPAEPDMFLAALRAEGAAA